MERLTSQINEMSEQLNLLKKQQPPEEEEAELKAQENTRVIAQENSLLCMTVQAQQWALWGAHATLSDWMVRLLQLLPDTNRESTDAGSFVRRQRSLSTRLLVSSTWALIRSSDGR